ncbi:hypothetical protein IWW38_000469 [Coemansia aciculifera]|uniref:Uncharacterized protein n=1 Tax=Coemansia aciculifera TaxID=417176 RepID=A0ACC1MAT6_9FUNG|nr:hypothetical protein IWW38_000469 [Coemansia aciculifera]
MSNQVYYSSMAAHAQYVPANLVPAYVTAAPQQHQAAVSGSTAPMPMDCSLERKPVPKRGRASDAENAPTDAMEVCGRSEDQQRCVFYRKSVKYTSPKRTKTTVETHV